MLITLASIQDPDSAESKRVVSFVFKIVRVSPYRNQLDQDDMRSIGLTKVHDCLRKRDFDLSSKRDVNYLIKAIKFGCIDLIRDQQGREGRRKKEFYFTNMVCLQEDESDLVYGEEFQYRGGEIVKSSPEYALDKMIATEENKKWSGISQYFWEKISEINPDINPLILQVMIHVLQKGCLIKEAAKDFGLARIKFSEMVRDAKEKGYLKHNFSLFSR